MAFKLHLSNALVPLLIHSKKETSENIHGVFTFPKSCFCCSCRLSALLMLTCPEIGETVWVLMSGKFYKKTNIFLI